MDKANERHVSRLDVPDADSAEQQEPVFPDGSDTEAEHLPPDAPEADYVEQHLSALPERNGTMHSVSVDAEASEADLAEQATPVPADDDEDYPYGAPGVEEADY